MHCTFAKKAEAIHRRPLPAAAIGRTIARAATSRFLPIVQAKLHIGAPNDKYEQEADRAADQVITMPEPKPTMTNSLHARWSVQRQCAGCSGRGELCSECEEELQCEPKEDEEEFQAEATPSQAPSLFAASRSEDSPAARWR
jgi:hypothetical protein